MDTKHRRDLSTDDFRAIVAKSVDGFILVDSSGDILDVNDSYCLMLGYDREELLNMHMSDIDAFESADDVAKRSQEIIHNGSLRFETKHLHKDGSAIDVEVSANFSLLHCGSFFSLVRDITQKNLIEKALRNSEQRYRKFIETASEGILVAQGNKLQFVNPVIPELIGYTEDELLTIPFLEFIHPDYRELMKNNHLKRIFGEPVDQRYEIQIVKKDGSFRWIEISGAKIDWAGQPATLNFVSDITDRKKADEALRQSEERFRNLLQDIPTIAVQGYGPDGTTQYWNKASEKLYGFSAEEAIGRNLLDLIVPPEARGDVEQAIRYMAETGVPIPASELSLIRKDGSQVSVFSSHAIVKTLACEQELFCFDIDLSEQIKADAEKQVLEQQLLHAQKMESLGVLAGGIAHDFNNLLAVIIGHCSLARLKPTAAPDNIRSIETAAERAAALCQQMLAYAGKANITKSLISIVELVDEMVRMSKSTISQNVNITCNYSPDIPLIRIDASQIRQITMNLIINASEAIGESQGEVNVSLAKTVIKTDKQAIDHVGTSVTPGLYACLQVTDNGCGMDSETQQRIFEPFYTTKFTGRGLGMSAVLGIIKAHNGALQLFSKPGRGTTFKVYLPIQMSESVQDHSCQPLASLETWKGSGTVLLVEDEKQVILIAKVILEELGFTVIVASNGKEALEKYEKNARNITLVLTDIGMPVMDGYELFRELKTLNPELPIIISSGFGETVVTSRIPIEAIAGLISKPYNFEQMREVLKSVLEGANN